MIRKDSLWTRFGQWMQAMRPDDTVPQLARLNGSLGLADNSKPSESQRIPTRDGQRAGPWRRRDRALENLRDGYDKVLDLVQSIQDHLTLQGQRSDQLSALLLAMSKGIEDVPRATRQQTETLTCLAGRLEANGRQNRTIAQTLSELPEASRAQTQVLESVAQKVGASAASTEKLADRLESLGRVVELLGTTLGEQVETLQQVQRSAQRQESHVAAVLDHHTRRFTLLTGVVLALVITATLATAINLFS